MWRVGSMQTPIAIVKSNLKAEGVRRKEREVGNESKISKREDAGFVLFFSLVLGFG